MYDYNQKPDLNITPLVDVMLVLLAILMVTAPVIEYEEAINLPKGSKSKKLQQQSKINILITDEKTIIVNKNRYVFENFADSFILFSKDKFTVPVLIAALNSTMHRADFGAIYLAVAISILPILIAFTLFSKFIISGISLGGVKE
jgi:biopolymer transport protein ExbD